jgi:hypothetical protein
MTAKLTLKIGCISFLENDFMKIRNEDFSSELERCSITITKSKRNEFVTLTKKKDFQADRKKKSTFFRRNKNCQTQNSIIVFVGSRKFQIHHDEMTKSDTSANMVQHDYLDCSQFFNVCDHHFFLSFSNIQQSNSREVTISWKERNFIIA